MDTLISSRKKILTGIGAFILLLVLVFFRERVSGFLSFRKVGSYPSVPLVAIPPQKSSAQEPNLPLPSGSGVNQVQSSPFPRYAGRDPEEVKPDPGQVRSFSSVQADELYADIRTYGRKLKKNSDDSQMWLQLGLLKKNIGDYIGARDAWEYAAIINPVHNVASKNLGQIYWHYLPDYPRAESEFRSAIRIAPLDGTTYLTLAEFYQSTYKEKANLAEAVLEEGLQVNPGDTPLMKALARLYADAKDYAKSLEWWKKVQEYEPNNSAVRDEIEALQAKMNH